MAAVGRSDVCRDGADGEGLDDHFDFAGPVGTEVDALGLGQAADAGDEEFTGDR